MEIKLCAPSKKCFGDGSGITKRERRSQWIEYRRKPAFPRLVLRHPIVPCDTDTSSPWQPLCAAGARRPLGDPPQPPGRVSWRPASSWQELSARLAESGRSSRTDVWLGLLGVPGDERGSPRREEFLRVGECPSFAAREQSGRGWAVEGPACRSPRRSASPWKPAESTWRRIAAGP
ncbi:uncharacterized protein ACOB8E_011997 isoform 2-T3 [Sarcophilus harrisii]